MHGNDVRSTCAVDGNDGDSDAVANDGHIANAIEGGSLG